MVIKWYRTSERIKLLCVILVHSEVPKDRRRSESGHAYCWSGGFGHPEIRAV